MHEELTDELMAMAAEDHAAVHKGVSDDFAEQLEWRRLTAEHADRLARILDEHGWPAVSTVGEEAARAAWLVAQHADRQLDLQRRALALMREAVAAGEASVRDLAFLHDRVRVNEGRPQTYGTQIAGVRDGVPVPWPCEDPEHMDDRRAAVGIDPFAVHVAKHAPR
ncbi:MAG TPA: DUF6624 domain-containing protein [Thermomonospora sp.]|nr:DUF6624 domain-containing protein [Thermomonospora sp.]